MIRCLAMVLLGLSYCLPCAAKQSGDAVVKNGQLRLVVAAKPVPFLRELVHKPSRRNLIAVPPSPILFSISLSGSGGDEVVESRTAKRSFWQSPEGLVGHCLVNISGNKQPTRYAECPRLAQGRHGSLPRRQVGDRRRVVPRRGATAEVRLGIAAAGGRVLCPPAEQVTPRRYPANSWDASPATPGVAANSPPAWGCSRDCPSLKPNRAVVM